MNTTWLGVIDLWKTAPFVVLFSIGRSQAVSPLTTRRIYSRFMKGLGGESYGSE